MRVAIEGCCHGELHKIYAALAKESESVDLLIICGDFQVSSKETCDELFFKYSSSLGY